MPLPPPPDPPPPLVGIGLSQETIKNDISVQRRSNSSNGLFDATLMVMDKTMRHWRMILRDSKDDFIKTFGHTAPS